MIEFVSMVVKIDDLEFIRKEDESDLEYLTNALRVCCDLYGWIILFAFHKTLEILIYELKSFQEFH